MPRCSSGTPQLARPVPRRYSEAVFRQLLALLVLLLGPLTGPGDAAEYRLRVANLYDKSFAAFVDGPIGLGDGELAMPRLEASLDESAVPLGALLGDRPLQGVPPAAVAAFGAVAPGPPAGPLARRCAGRERPVVRGGPAPALVQEIAQVAIKGTGPLRYYLPYSVGIAATYAAGRYPLGWIQFQQARGTLWSRYLARLRAFRRASPPWWG